MKNLISLLLFSFFISTQCLANGGWVGMGGELFKDARNPWFVKNTSQIFYCLQVSEKEISVSDKTVDEALQDAIKFWKSEFSRASFAGQNGYFELGTQDFVRRSCGDSKVHLRIIFGASLLSDEEIEFLKDPAKFVGVTVRTSYDLKELKAQGFMFFANDLKSSKVKPAGNFLEKAWSHPKILRYALMHELGHVFGLPHMGTGLMSEIFLDQLMKPEYLHFYQELPFEAVIQPDPSAVICDGLTNVSRQFFSIPAAHSCLVTQGGVGTEIQIYSKKDKISEEKQELGKIFLQRPNLNELMGKPVSFLQLSDEQEVFTPQERQFRLFMVGPVGAEFGTKGKFAPKIPAPSKSVYLRVTPNSLTILGNQASGEIENVLQYSSLLGLIYLIPARPSITDIKKEVMDDQLFKTRGLVTSCKKKL